MGSNGLKAILFDLDNTLIDTAGVGKIAIQKVHRLLKDTFGHEDHIGEICDRFKLKLLHESFDPTVSTIDDVRTSYWDQAIREIKGTSPSPTLAPACYELWKTTRLQHLAVPDPVRGTLEELRKKYKLLLLTNGDSQTQREKIEAVQCGDLFDAVVVGGEHPEQKPALSIFLHCFDILAVKPSECIMVGDSLDTDIQGGSTAGVRATVWVSANDRPASAVTPDYTIATVLELPRILEDMKLV
ncbi:N-acylneuraminate-9-phosphatase [Lepisosteus oculatus]|uniref:N-acylneuraminate-9-phosphatase n=1 Tax=Lepisosteus oculatus TaxID=7918 RepID=UPI0035F50282